MTKKKVIFGESMSRGQELRRAALSAWPGLAWVTLFLLLPMAAVVGISFLRRGDYGGIERVVTLENFKRFAGFGLFGFDALYPRMVLRTVLLSAGTTLLCLLLSLPLTFFLAGLMPRRKAIGLMLVIVPFWTNMLIRTYAWQILLSPQSWLARCAAALGLIPAGEALYPGLGAVLLVMTCDFLPMLALPLYASVEKIDWTIAEAASDLGANGWRVFWHALLPQIKPGLSAGAILVFVAATGQFVIPDLMGGAKTMLLGNAIQQQFGLSRDWPFGSAISSLLIAVVMCGLWLFKRTSGEEGKDALA